MRSLLNPNTTAEAVSAENVVALTHRMGSNIALVRNSPNLITLYKSAGVETIYRSAAVDGGIREGAVATQWVNDLIDAAPDADWFEVSNEIGLGPAQDAYMQTCATAAEARGKRITAYSVQASQPDSAWQASLPTMQELARRGHAMSAHIYKTHNPVQIAGAESCLKFLDLIDGVKFISEWGYLHDGDNDAVGYRADFDPRPMLNDWIDGAIVPFVNRGLVLFMYCTERWPNNAQGDATGFAYGDQPAILDHCLVINGRYSSASGHDFTRGVVHPKAGYVNVRSGFSTTYPALAQLHNGDRIQYYPTRIKGGNYSVSPGVQSSAWLQVSNGWIAADVVTISAS